MRGEWGERVALDHLCENGYDIVEQNFRSRYGEIDIVAQQGDTIVFIEVKTRAPHAMVTGIESISPSKQKKLRYTAEMYLTKFNNMPPARFDVIDIVANGWTVESIELIVDAF
ncbi:MAG: YraN family protein [Oscillospiraceae bacterium]|nr:YraN family protein [Oscillospiraceae bacterium]